MSRDSSRAGDLRQGDQFCLGGAIYTVEFVRQFPSANSVDITAFAGTTGVVMTIPSKALFDLHKSSV